MTKIKNYDDFNNLTSNITSFSHAYLFNTNSLSSAYEYVKVFAKKIICRGQYIDNCQEECDICYQIDHDEFDDFYVINPDTIGINTEEIEKLFDYMKTKSIHPDGRRVYIIYGFERLSHNVSNKILKFLEEPVENLYALLITENIDQILSTIISRCQIIDLMFDNNDENNEMITKMKGFLSKIEKCGNSTIAYYNDYFDTFISDRIMINNAFQCLETILSQKISAIINKEDSDFLVNVPLNTIVNVLEITNKIKKLIRQNINLNLLIDRYIIEVSKELEYAKNSRNNV